MKNVVLTALALVMPAAAVAQEQCAPREVVIGILADRYGEARHVLGVAGDGSALVEVFGNTTTGTWTITVTSGDGTMCVVADGAGFELVDEAPQGMTF